MSKIGAAVELARCMAADGKHGYDQSHRWGPDYDCSSLIITVWEQVGVPVRTGGATYTGNMREVFLRCGFADVTGEVSLGDGRGLVAGDVLLNHRNHTAMMVDKYNLVQARINELGTVTGGQTGDQNGGEIAVRSYYNYPWDCVLRYAGDAPVEVAPLPFGEPATPSEPIVADTNVGDNTYVVQRGDSWWAIANKKLGSGTLWEQLMRLNGYESPDEPIYPGMVIKLWDDNCPTCKIDPEPLEHEEASVRELKRYLEEEVRKLGGTVTWH